MPILVVVSGPPGSGKTQLAHAIARAIGCPVISRDEIKEGMVHGSRGEFTAAIGDALTARTFPLFFDVLRLLLTEGVTVVAEAAFQDQRWQLGLEPLAGLAELRIIHCTVSDALARERIARRSTEEPSRAAHADRALLAAGASSGPFRRISITAPSLEVDTTDGYAPSLAEIVRFISTAHV